MDRFDRTKLLIGEENVIKLSQQNVIVFGVGGVGGYSVEMLVRSGIGNITIVDFDVVSKTNLNRQIIALNSTLNKLKVDVMKDRILDINENCNVKAIAQKLSLSNIDEFKLKNYDYVIDCIDMVNEKIALIEYCYQNNIRCISAMGAGNRKDIPNFVVKDIFKTSYDGLAKIVRKKLKEKCVLKHNVVICEQESIKQNVVGSVVYYPAMCGCVLSAKVINDLIN